MKKGIFYELYKIENPFKYIEFVQKRNKNNKKIERKPFNPDLILFEKKLRDYFTFG